MLAKFLAITSLVAFGSTIEWPTDDSGNNMLHWVACHHFCATLGDGERLRNRCHEWCLKGTPAECPTMTPITSTSGATTSATTPTTFPQRAPTTNTPTTTTQSTTLPTTTTPTTTTPTTTTPTTTTPTTTTPTTTSPTATTTPTTTTTPTSNVRLAEPTYNGMQLLQVRVGGVWGTVCDDHFGLTDAMVACKSLGFSEVENPAFTPDNTGRGQIDHSAQIGIHPTVIVMPILMDDLECTGTETGLHGCPHTSSHNCGHFEDVYLRCPQGNVRLAEPTYNGMQLLQVRVGGVWGTVCDDHFGLTDAMVACKSLGFSEVENPTFKPDGVRVNQLDTTFNEMPIHMDELGCTGTEVGLQECPHTSSHDCEHPEDVYLRCDQGSAEYSYKLL